ncbi:MAG: NnrU family protein [Myxococcota bacterium]
MSTPALIALLWLLFAITHVGMSSLRWRPRLVAALGEGPFRGLYSLVSLVIFVPLVSIYLGDRHSGAYLGSLAGLPGMRPVMYVGMGLALTLMVGGLRSPAPTSFLPGPAEARGVLRVTRHPLLMGLGLFGLLHLAVVAVNTAELAFFGGFPLFVALGCWHQDQRKLAEGDADFGRFHAATPFLPLPTPAAVVAAVREQPLEVGIGIAATVGLRFLHPVWFGVG